MKSIVKQRKCKFTTKKYMYRPSAFGIFVVIVLKMLTRTRNIVIRSVILNIRKLHLLAYIIRAREGRKKVVNFSLLGGRVGPDQKCAISCFIET